MELVGLLLILVALAPPLGLESEIRRQRSERYYHTPLRPR